MRIYLILLALALLVSSCSAAGIRPDQLNNSLPFPSILMDEDANITLDGGFILGAQGISKSYTIWHDATEVYGADQNGSIISSASYTTPGGFGTVFNSVVADINLKDIGTQIVITPGNYYPGDVDLSDIPPWVTVSGINYPFVGHQGELPTMTAEEVTRFIITNSTYVPIKLPYSGSAVEKISFFYPDQSGNSTPSSYAPAIRIGGPAGSAIIGESNMVRYVDLGNTYTGIEFGETDGRAIIEHVVGYPLQYGIKQNSSEILEVCQISDVHFNPRYIDGWGYYEGTLPAWVGANGEAMYINRIDGLRVRDFFGIYYNKGINITGPLYRASFIGCYLDCVNFGIYSIGGTIANSDFSNCHIFSNTFAIYIGWGVLNRCTFDQIEVESYQDGIYILDPYSTNTHNTITDSTIYFHRNASYLPGVVRGALLYGDNFVFSNNHVIGFTSPESQGLLFFNTTTATSNHFENLTAVAVEIGPFADAYIVANNVAETTGGFPSELNTTSKFVGHNVAS